MKRVVAVGLLAAALVPSWAPVRVLARAMLITASYPAAKEVVNTQNAHYSVRFDGPVDHRQSSMSITGTDGKLVGDLHPLLDSATNVLFATGLWLPEGDYQLHFSVRSVPDGEVSSGYVPFTVKQ
jgi:methionine-rich copper-binding protein CopC